MPTLKKSRNSSKNNDPTRPFEKKHWTEAQNIAAHYRLVLEPNDELGFIGSAVEMPTVFADGPSPDKCVDAVREALVVAVATLLEAGQRPPHGSSTRSEQVNVRLSPEEKFTLEHAAGRFGFKGISDFVRTVALDRCVRN